MSGNDVCEHQNANYLRMMSERDELRAEVERLREDYQAACEARMTFHDELDEAQRQVADLRTGIEALMNYASSEVADAKAGEAYAAEVNQGALLASEQARRWAWEAVLRKVSALLGAQGREADDDR